MGKQVQKYNAPKAVGSRKEMFKKLLLKHGPQVVDYASKYAQKRLSEALSEKPKSQSRKVRKIEGKDHPVQSYGSIDGDNLYIGRMKRKLPKRISKQKLSVTWFYPGIVGSVNTGEQAVDDVVYLGTPNQFLTSSGNSYNNSGAPVALFNAIPGEIIGDNPNTGSFYNGKTATAVTYSELFLKNISVQLSLCNHSTAGTYVDVYVLQAKINTNLGMLSAWSYADELYNTTAASSNTRITAAAVSQVTGYCNPYFYGMRPKTSRKFNEVYKIVAVKSYDLAAGNNNQLMNINIRVGKVFSKNKIANMQGNVMKGGYSIMIVARGQNILQNDSVGTGSAVDNLLPTYAPPRVSYIARVSMTFSPLVDKSSASNAHLINSIVVATPFSANTKQINTGTGVEAAFDQA